MSGKRGRPALRAPGLHWTSVCRRWSAETLWVGVTAGQSGRAPSRSRLLRRDTERHCAAWGGSGEVPARCKPTPAAHKDRWIHLYKSEKQRQATETIKQSQKKNTRKECCNSCRGQRAHFPAM